MQAIVVQNKLMISFTISSIIIVSLLLLVVPFVSSSQEHAKTDHKHSIHHHQRLTSDHKLSFEITLHGLLLWASMGFLMPLGILTIRMSNRQQCGTRLKIILYIHATLQTLSVLVATAGAIMSIKNFENCFNNTHQRMGLTLYGAIWLQALIGFLRPHRGSRGRSVWFFVHWVLGTAVCTLGIINIYTGLQAYHKRTSTSISLWIIIFTAQISFIAFFYLFQDKWDHIHKQGVILGSDPLVPIDQEEICTTTRDKKTKESLTTDSC